MPTRKQYWLMKSEPDEYSIDDLRREKQAPWFGVRNYQARNFMYQARNFMRDTMRVGDEVLFYHSSCPTPGVAGLARVVSRAYPDETQFDEGSPYYDPKAARSAPRWMLVNVQFVKKFKQLIALTTLRKEKTLAELIILRPGNRLSITPLTAAEYKRVVSLAR